MFVNDRVLKALMVAYYSNAALKITLLFSFVWSFFLLCSKSILFAPVGRNFRLTFVVSCEIFSCFFLFLLYLCYLLFQFVRFNYPKNKFYFNIQHFIYNNINLYIILMKINKTGRDTIQDITMISTYIGFFLS